MRPYAPFLAAVTLLALSACATSHAAPVVPDAVQAPAAPRYEIIIDTTETPDLKEWAETLRPIVDAWYPKIVEMLPSEGYTAPQKVTITFKKIDGIAYASGTQIVGAEAWFKRRPEDRGAIVHELAHVVQQYRSRRNPGWLVEGLADYVRWFNYEPLAKRPRPNPDRAKYTDSYQTTGAFLEYVVKNHDPQFVVKMNAAMRQGKYQPELWKEYTGKTVDELWALYIATLQSK